jgi:hypothetical protein
VIVLSASNTWKRATRGRIDATRVTTSATESKTRWCAVGTW